MTEKEIDAFKHRINVKAWKARNPEKVKAYKRSAYLRRKARIKQAKAITLSPTMPTPRKSPATESTITVASRPITLRRPVRADFAKRLAENHARLTALNTAGKSQKDAAEAMGISVPLLRTWLDVLNLKWTNIQPRAPYSLR